MFRRAMTDIEGSILNLFVVSGFEANSIGILTVIPSFLLTVIIILISRYNTGCGTCICVMSALMKAHDHSTFIPN